MSDYREHIAELRAEVESAKADLCPCGVPYENCTDHDSREADDA